VALQGLAFAAHGLLRKYGLSGNKEPEIVLAEARRARRYLREISRQLALAIPPTVSVARRSA